MWKKILEMLFPDTLEALKKEAFQQGRQESSKEYLKNTEFVRGLELESLVGKPVMCFSNEFEDPVVGIAKKVDLITQGNCPVLIVHDYVSNKDVFVMGVTLVYHEQFLKDIISLDPCARLALLYRVTYIDSYASSISKRCLFTDVELSTYEQLKEKLQDNGFYDKVAEINLNKTLSIGDSDV